MSSASSKSQTNGRTLRIRTAKIFRPLLEPARYKGAYGGRGSGKSHFFAELIVEYCILHPGARIICVRQVQHSLKESVKLLVEDKIRQFGVEHLFKVLHDRIETPGGGVMLFQGMQEHTKETIKSLENFQIAYVEEAQTMTKGALEMLRPTIRAPGSELWFSWNPRSASDPVDKLLRGPNPPPNAIVIRVGYEDNIFWPDVLDGERRYDEVHNRDRYGHVWLGHYEPQALGAIWDRATIEQGRWNEPEPPDCERIVVSVDPAISAEEGSNEHGVVVCGLGADGRGYVLEDASMRGGPKQWAHRALAMFDKWEADSIVIEINQGGDMVRHTLEAARPTVPVTEVRATKGKHVRAEPISALYNLGRISHVGAFPQLEDQMCLCTAAGYEGEGSPDRMDALVWGMTTLFPELIHKPEKERHYEPAYAGPDAWMAG